MKTNLYAFFCLAVCLLSAATADAATRTLSGNATDGYYIVFSTSGNDELEITAADIAAGITSFKVRDDDGYIQNGASTGGCSYISGNLVLSAPSGYVFQVRGTIIGYSGLSGQIAILDGGTSAETLYSRYDGKQYDDLNESGDIKVVTSSTNQMTLNYYGRNVDFDIRVDVLSKSDYHDIVAKCVDGGCAKVDLNKAIPLTTVPVELKADDNYLPIGVSIVSSDASSVNMNMYSSFDAQVSFSMPYGNVTITPTFTNNLTADGGVFARLPYSGSETIVIPSNVKSFKVINEVDEQGYYKKGTDGSLVLTAPENKQLVVTGMVNLESYSNDELTIFDGEENDNVLLLDLNGSDFGYDEEKNVGKLRATKGKMTIKFKDDPNNNYSYGLALEVMVVDPAKKYSVSVPETINGGIMDVSLSEAVYDQVVTLTMTPESKYYLGDIDILSDGKMVSYERVRIGSAEQVTFEMPNGNVTITPRFVNTTDVGYRNDGALRDSIYFLMKCENSVCTISQGFFNAVTYQGDDVGQWQYFKHWFRGSVNRSYNCEEYRDPLNISNVLYRNCDFGLMDVYRTLYADYEVKFVDTLRFGGYDSGSGKCAMQFEPFTGEKTGYQTKYDITIQGEKAVIDGLCQESVSHFGLANIADDGNTNEISVRNLAFKNVYIDAKNNANEYVNDVGVVAGLSYKITIDDIHIENARVKAKSDVGGLVGRSLGDITIRTSSIKMSEDESLSGDGGSSVVGGIVGHISRVGVNSVKVNIRNTYSIGKIDAPSVNGFVVGSMEFPPDQNTDIQSNYHFGPDNLVYGIGGGFYTQLADWLDAYGNGFSNGIYGNIRNANANVPVNGSLSIGANSVQTSKSNYRLKNGSNVYHNGAVLADSMKTRRFAAVLNSAYNSIWTSVPGVNDGLPFIADDTYSSIKIIGFSTDNFGTYANADNRAAYEAAIASGYIDEGYCGSGCGGFSLYTNHQGHLDRNQVDFLNELTNDEHYWYSSEGAISTSRRYDSNVDGEFTFYQYSSNISLNVAYYLCTGKYNRSSPNDPYVCSGEETLINSKDLDSVGFLTPPVSMFALSDDVLIPEMLVVRSTGAISALQSKIMRFTRAKNSTYSNDATYEFTDRYFSGLHTIERTNELATLYNFDENDYNDTLHLLYSLEDGDVGSASIVNGNAAGTNTSVLPFSYKPLVYNIAGALVNIGSASVASQSRVPVTPSFSVNAPAGYKLQEYTIELGNMRAQNPSVIETIENFLATTDEFVKNVDKKIWKKTVTDVTESITLDSVYKGMIDENVEHSLMQMTITPTYSLVDYTVNFDLQPLSKGENAYVVLGNNWTIKKDNMNVETNNEFPKLYIKSETVGTGVNSVNYTAMEWSTKDDATSGPHSSALTSEFLDGANDPGTELTLYPYPPRKQSDAATAIRVIAVDENGNAMTGKENYHGTVALIQKVSGEENALAFKQPSDSCIVNAGANGANDVYTHCLYVPNVDDTLTFEVSTEPNLGYAMFIKGQSFKWQDPASGVAEDKPGFGYNVTGADTTLVVQPHYMTSAGMSFKVKYIVTGPFYVEYNLNTAPEDYGKLYFPIDAKKYDTLTYDETVITQPLWEPFRTDKCFAGWYDKGKVVTAGSNGAYKSLDADYAMSLSFSMDPDYPTEIYAIWDDCASGPATGVTIANENTNAEIMLKQVLDGTEYEHLLGKDAIALPANSSGYKFFIDATNSNVALGYEPGDISAEYDMSGTRYEMTVDGDSIVVGNTNISEFFITMETPSSLYRSMFWMNVNADTVFYGTSFNDFEVHAQKDDSITTDIYRIGYKLKGWSFSVPQKSSETSQQPTQQLIVAYAPATHSKFDSLFEDDYIKFAKTYNRLPDTLYAVWEKDDNSSVRYVVNKDPNVNAFTFKLSQEVQGTPFHYFVTDSLAVPAVDGIEFNMELLYDPDDFDIDSKRAIVVLNEKDEQLGILENSSWLSLSESVGLRANILKDKRVRLDLDENTKDTLFHGSDWIDKIDFDQDSVKSVDLPTLAYNAEKCLAGWTTDTTSDKLFTVVNDDLLTELRAQSKSQNVDISALLHAKWTTNPDSCAGQFVQLAVEQDNGTIWFAEKDKDNTIERRFTDKGTMFVPMELKGDNLKVQASGADTSVYVLDSLVVLRFGDRDTVLHEGDYMPEVLDNVTLKAYFGWKNKTEVAFKNVRLDSNGVAFRLNFKASDFEVRRNVSAHLRVIDKVRKRPPVVDVTLGDSIAMGFETKDFNFRMDKPGKYRMELTLKGKADSVVTDSIDFSVSAAIPAIAADTWQMISLSAVDLSAIKNDGDRIFYWWDERGTGEFWQYKKLNLKDSIDPTRGVWYNSREGRALPLLDEFDTKDDDFAWELENVNTGWNMVANPYNWTLDLYAKKPSDRKNMGDDSEISFWSYDADAGEPVPTDTIRPYESVWAYVPKKSAEWKMSAAPFFPPEAVALEKRALAKASTKDRWTLQAVLTDMNGKRDSWNILGAGLNPTTAEEPPEYMGDHVNLAIVEGKRALAKSIKAASDEMEWKVALSASSDRVGYLGFAGIDGVNAFGYRVFVTVDGNTTEMREGEPLKVYLKSSAKMATVRVAPAAKMIAKNTIRGLRTARLGNRLQVTFDASGLAGTNARVDILDMKGHVKSTATAKTLDGSNALVLDAPQSGLYMLRVRAGSQQQAVKILVR